MDEQLKFSWGHIIAFLALIFISYITFVGMVYQTDGDFIEASITMVVVDTVLAVFFVGSQLAKATAHKFSKRIWLERIGIFFSPVVFVLCLLPYFHFWAVHSHNDEIVNDFQTAINASKDMFSEYDEYAQNRIDNYQTMLDRVISNQSVNPESFAACGFTTGEEHIQEANMVKALRLQLLSCNYDSLKISALNWIESSSKGASTWNVFLLGNTKEIKSAIRDWNRQLCEFSHKKLRNEEFMGNEVKDFYESNHNLYNVEKGLDGLTVLFSQNQFPGLTAIVIAILLYLAMLFPYLLQDRHTKSVYSLFGMEKGHNGNCLEDEDEIPISSYYTKEDNASNNSAGDDYSSFTL